MILTFKENIKWSSRKIANGRIIDLWDYRNASDTDENSWMYVISCGQSMRRLGDHL